MAKRTPGLQTRSQFHGYWGQFQYDTSVPPATFAGRTGDVGSTLLPNTSTPLSTTEFDKLEAGDTASTINAITVVDGTEFGLWTCIDPGTVGVGGAVWVRMDNMNSTQVQTIRDAHRIVVGIAGTTTGVPATDTLLNLAPYTAGVSADFIDPGDGSGLALALAAATAISNAVDVRIVSGTIDLDTGPVVAAFAVTDNVRLMGAGSIQTNILGRSTGDQSFFALGRDVSLEGLSLDSPTPGAGITGTSAGLIQATGIQAGNFSLRDLRITIVDDATRVAKVGVFAIAAGSGAPRACSIDNVSVNVLNSLGTAGISTEGYVRSSFSNCTVTGATTGIRLSSGVAPLFGNDACSITNFKGFDIQENGILIETDGGGAPFYGVSVSDSFVRFDDASADPLVQSAIHFNNKGITDQASVSGLQAHWGANAATTVRAFGRVSTTESGARVSGISFTGCGVTWSAPGFSAGLTTGLLLDALDADSIIGSDSSCDFAGVGPLTPSNVINVPSNSVLWEHSHPRGLA